MVRSGQVRISVAALGADFLDEVGGHLHQKAETVPTPRPVPTPPPPPPPPPSPSRRTSRGAFFVELKRNLARFDRSRAIVSRPILATQKSSARALWRDSCEALHLKGLRQLRIKFNYATYNDQGELQTDGRQYLWWCGKDRTAIGHHRHRCRCCLLWSKEAVQGLHLCQKPSNQLRKRRRRTQPQVTALPTSSLMPSSM